MRYFIVEQDKQFSDAPDILNWYSSIDVRDICWGRSFNLPERTLLLVRPTQTLVFPDLITHPFLLCTNLVREMIDAFEREVIYKQVVLMDQENRQTAMYYLPILETVDCLADTGTLNSDCSLLHEAVFDKSKIPGFSIFWLDKLSRRYLVMRLDILERFLQRGVKYLSLQEIRLQ